MLRFILISLIQIISIFNCLQITNEVALVLLSAATILLIVPFKYILFFVLSDFFTRELDFRKEMVRRFMNFLKEWWATVPATPVVVLPYECECDSAESADQSERESDSKRKAERNWSTRNSGWIVKCAFSSYRLSRYLLLFLMLYINLSLPSSIVIFLFFLFYLFFFRVLIVLLNFSLCL